MRRDVHNLHVVGDDESFQSRGNFSRQAGLEIQKQFIRERENIQIAFHFPLGCGDGGVAAFAGAEFFHIVRHLPVQKTRAVRAGQADARTKAQINHTRAGPQRGVFSRPVAVISDDFRAI